MKAIVFISNKCMTCDSFSFIYRINEDIYYKKYFDISTSNLKNDYREERADQRNYLQCRSPEELRGKGAKHIGRLSTHISIIYILLCCLTETKT